MTNSLLLLQLLALTSSGWNARKAFPAVMKHLVNTDIMVKKLACWFITTCAAEETGLILLAVNTLVNDCSSPNPVIRGLALKTLSSLRQTSLLEYCMKPMLTALNDTNPYVRRIAVLACVRIHNQCPENISQHGIVDRLYAMIRDPDPIVTVNCLSVLDEILGEEGGVVINKNIAYYLLNRISELTEWGLTVVLQLLTRYSPASDDECLDAMNIVDRYLSHANSTVVISTLQYLLHLIKNMPHLHADVFARAHNHILHFLSTGNAELTYVLLNFVDNLLDKNRDIFGEHYKLFFCKYNEPLYLKVKKIGMLPMLTTEDNGIEMISELGICASGSSELAAAATAAIGNIASAHPDMFDMCLRKLLDLLHLNLDYVTSSVLAVLKNVDFRNPNDIETTMHEIAKCLPQITSKDGQSALLWMLGEYGDHLENSAYILEEYVDDVESMNSDVKLSCLTAAAKLFFKKPAECQEMLGSVLEHCLSNSDLLVKETALYYYRLLKIDVNEAKLVVCGSD